MTLPNATDQIPIGDLIPNLADKEIKIDALTLASILSDLHYAQGYADALELAIKQLQPKSSGDGK